MNSQSIELSPSGHVPTEIQQTSELLKRLFQGFKGTLAFKFWNGTTVKLGNFISNKQQPDFTLVCRNQRVIRSILLGHDPLRFVEAYFHDDLDIEGNIFDAVSLKDCLYTPQISLLDRLGAMFTVLRLKNDADVESADLTAHAVKAHTKAENREAIAFHYDVSNEFYGLWLDKSMVYSCAYFESPDATLEQAQRAKLDHICRKLLLKPGEKFLDIGCGWGALVIHAAKHYGVHSHGITLSQRQLELATKRINDAGLQDMVTVELRDYRDLPGEAVYDKISSVGMFEHIGLNNLPVYFDIVNRQLKPGGLFLNHGITHDVEGWEKTLSTEFINRYVFPDGQLDTVGNIQRVMERSRFEILDVEALRSHYAITLRNWVARLEAHHTQALKYVSEATYRVWRLYMAACALEFETGEIGVYQILSSKRDNRQSATPLTRKHLYS
ncbi:MAG TPA: cyclopropane-fatty-acyl-phospholipid synthase family protein [Methylophilaceae bacterium]